MRLRIANKLAQTVYNGDQFLAQKIGLPSVYVSLGAPIAHAATVSLRLASRTSRTGGSGYSVPSGGFGHAHAAQSKPLADAAVCAAKLANVIYITAPSVNPDENGTREDAKMKISLAIDDSAGSQAAIRAVAERARREGAEVKVLHVVELPFSAAESTVVASHHVGKPENFGVLLRELSKRAQVLVENAVAELQRAGVRATADVKYGDPKSVIIDDAAEWKADLIVVGAHGYGGVERFLMGSVSNAVARHAACSVEIVRTAKRSAAA